MSRRRGRVPFDGTVQRVRIPVRLILISVLVVTVSTQPVFLLGASFFSIGPEFGLGPVGLGLLTAGFFLTAAASSAPLGRWVERVGWRRAMTVNVGVVVAVLTAFAVAVNSVWVFLALLAIAAATYGMANPAANLALSRHVAAEHQATIFGVKHAGIPTSTLLAGVAVPALVVNFGWRVSYGAAALLALGVLGAIRRLDLPEEESPPPTRPGTGSRLMPRALLAGLALGSSLATWGALALGAFGVSAAVEAGWSEAAAGWLLFMGSAFSILGRVVAGIVTDRRGGPGFGGVVVLVGLGAVVFALIPFAHGPWFAAAIVVAFVTGWGWPGLMTFSVVNANRGAPATSSGITQAGVFVGAGVGPLVLGLVVEHVSFSAAWWLVATMSGLAAVTVAWVGRRATRVVV